MQLDRHAEWNQIYFECLAAHARLLLLADDERHRLESHARQIRGAVPVCESSQRSYLSLGELIGELNNGHAYVAGGERPETPRIKLGLLGAEFSRDPASTRLSHRADFAGENWDKQNRSPLTAIGVNVKPGDYILAINGMPVSTLPNLYDALIGTADKQVILRVNSKPSDEGARDVTVVPDRGRIGALLLCLGAKEHRLRQEENRMAKSAIFTSPTWGNPA